jgi:hypothetical protein
MHVLFLFTRSLLLLLVIANPSACTKQNYNKNYPSRIKNNQVILVRQNGNYGAFFLVSQTETMNKGSQVTLQYYYRTDGGPNLDPSDPNVLRGVDTVSSFGNPFISFGNFQVKWSFSANGVGSIYYNRSPQESPKPDDLYLAVTSLSSLEGLNAADPRWNYRSAPPDQVWRWQ